MCNEDHYRPILDQLQRCKRNRRGWEALCPVHEADGQQHRPSLFASIGRTGALLVQCSACRCTVQQVADALGLRVSDFFPPTGHSPTTPRPTQRNMSDKLIVEYDYFDENNVYQYTICRYEPKNFRIKRKLGDGREEWGLGDKKTVLYRLPELMAAEPKAICWVVEGERDVDRLRALGLAATCNPFGAGKWRPQFADKFVAKYVVVIADNDEVGERHAQEVVNSLLGKAKGVKKISFNGGYPKGADVTTFLESGGTKEELNRIVKETALITEPFVIQPAAPQSQTQSKPTTQPNTEGQRTEAPERKAAPPRTDAPATEGRATEGRATDGATRRAAPPNGSGGAAPESGYEKKKVTLKRIVEVSNELPPAERVLIAQAILSGVAVELAK